MAMKSREYWKKREAENAMKNQISEVQYKKDIEEIYANMKIGRASCRERV